MKFEIGKAYKHASGEIIQIICKINTWYYGECLLGETDKGELVPMGMGENNTINWVEISMTDFKAEDKKEECIRNCEAEKLKDACKKVVEKDLNISDLRPDKDNISDLKTYGETDNFALLCKASSQEQGWMKSTKVCNCDNGCIVQVTTQQRNPNGSYSVAEALTYVPGMNLDRSSEPRKLIAINK